MRVELLRWIWAPALLAALVGCEGGDGAAASSKVVEAPPPRTTTTTLPEATNDAWEMAPFQLRDLQGDLHTLADWKGKVILLNFWASWCSPCQYEIPDFVRYQRELGERGLQIVGIGVDAKRKLANVARTLGINYPVLVLEPAVSRRLMAQWGNDTGIIPYTVVIARDGRIKYMHRGILDALAFDTHVRPLL